MNPKLVQTKQKSVTDNDMLVSVWVFDNTNMMTAAGTVFYSANLCFVCISPSVYFYLIQLYSYLY